MRLAYNSCLFLMHDSSSANAANAAPPDFLITHGIIIPEMMGLVKAHWSEFPSSRAPSMYCQQRPSNGRPMGGEGKCHGFM